MVFICDQMTITLDSECSSASFNVSLVVFLLAQTEMWLQFVDYVVDHLLKLQGPPTGCRDG